MNSAQGSCKLHNSEYEIGDSRGSLSKIQQLMDFKEPTISGLSLLIAIAGLVVGEQRLHSNLATPAHPNAVLE